MLFLLRKPLLLTSQTPGLPILAEQVAKDNGTFAISGPALDVGPRDPAPSYVECWLDPAPFEEPYLYHFARAFSDAPELLDVAAPVGSLQHAACYPWQLHFVRPLHQSA